MDKVSFKIPGCPPSLNATYKVNYRTKCVYLDESVRNYKNQAILFIPPFKIEPQEKVILTLEYHGKFYNNDGTIKRRDVQNLDKCLCDVIFSKLGADDSCVWMISACKVEDLEEFVQVTIIKIGE